MTVLSVIAVHRGVKTPIHPLAAETYGIEQGESITDSDLRRIVRCTAAIAKTDERLRRLVLEHNFWL